MSATYDQGGLIEFDPAMRGAFIGSTVFHVIIFILATIGLPFIAKDHLTISTPISVEIIDVAALSQTNKPPKPKPPEKAPEKPPPPKMDAQTPPDLTRPKPPELDQDVAELREAVPPPKPLKKMEVKKPKPKKPPKPKKAPKKPKSAQKQDDFTKLLRNMAPDAKTPSEKVPVEKPGEQVSPLVNLADKLTISELDAVKRGLMPCWNIQIGSKNAQDQIVEIRVLMNPDRSVQQATILNQGRYNRDSHFRAAADAALRALRNPRCSPLQLPPNKYEQWKTTVIEFNPRDVL